MSNETYYLNKGHIIYLKKSPAGSARGSIYKAVLINDKQIIIPNSLEFDRIKKELNME